MNTRLITPRPLACLVGLGIFLSAGMFPLPICAGQTDWEFSLKNAPFLKSSPIHSDRRDDFGDDLDAESIGIRLATEYQYCKSYRDSGTVQILLFTGNKLVRKEDGAFETAFARPDRFRFEYKSRDSADQREAFPSYHAAVWGEGTRVHGWSAYASPTEHIESEESKSLALLVAYAGVTEGTSRTIPALLLPKEVGKGFLYEMTDCERIPNARLDNIECLRVKGRIMGSGDLLIWIDKQTYLVRRIDEKMQFDDFRTETTTTYHPIINGAIPTKMLRFTPPKRSDARKRTSR